MVRFVRRCGAICRKRILQEAGLVALFLEDNCYVSLLAFWHSVGAETCLALGSSGPWKGHLWSWYSRRRPTLKCFSGIGLGPSVQTRTGRRKVWWGAEATSQQMMSPISTAPPPRCRFFLLFLLAFLFFYLFFLLAFLSHSLVSLDNT